MAAMTKRCKYERCNQKFKTYRTDQDCCSPACNAAVKAQERSGETLNGKKVLFKARGAQEDGLHPNDRQLVPRQSFVVEVA